MFVVQHGGNPGHLDSLLAGITRLGGKYIRINEPGTERICAWFPISVAEDQIAQMATDIYRLSGSTDTLTHPGYDTAMNSTVTTITLPGGTLLQLFPAESSQMFGAAYNSKQTTAHFLAEQKTNIDEFIEFLASREAALFNAGSFPNEIELERLIEQHEVSNPDTIRAGHTALQNLRTSTSELINETVSQQEQNSSLTDLLFFAIAGELEKANINPAMVDELLRNYLPPGSRYAYPGSVSPRPN